MSVKYSSTINVVCTFIRKDKAKQIKAFRRLSVNRVKWNNCYPAKSSTNLYHHNISITYLKYLHATKFKSLMFLPLFTLSRWKFNTTSTQNKNYEKVYNGQPSFLRNS